jgi:hypothetical protein
VFASAFLVTACSPSSRPVTGSETGDPTWLGGQAETAATYASSGSGYTLVVTYNDDTDDGKIAYTSNDRIVFPGASLLGWSYSLDRGQNWIYGGKVKPPPGIGALWGDPAIVTSGADLRRVYISNLAAASSKMPSTGVHGPDALANAMSGACVARSDDGGIHFTIQDCFSANGDFYDGGSLAAASPNAFADDRRVFAAYLDAPNNRIDVWVSWDGFARFVQLPNPFPGMHFSTHPQLAYDRSTGSLLVAAATVKTDAELSFVWMNRLVGSAWQTPKLVSHPVSAVDVSFGGIHLRSADLFSFDVGTPSQTALPGGGFRTNYDSIRLLYTTRDARTQRTYIRGTGCSSDLMNCVDVPAWGTTPGNFNTPGDQWNPSVKAWPGTVRSPPVWKATYESTDDTPNGISIKEGNLIRLPNGVPYFLPFDLVGPRLVCSTRLGFWGDYNNLGLAGVNPRTSAPEFLLAFTDSSKGCLQQFDFTSRHMHVSAKVFS